MKEDLTGKRYARITVLAFDHYASNGQSIWKCQCDCGTTFLTYGANLKRGMTKSCGCLRSEVLAQRNRQRKGLARYANLETINKVRSIKIGDTIAMGETKHTLLAIGEDKDTRIYVFKYHNSYGNCDCYKTVLERTLYDLFDK